MKHYSSGMTLIEILVAIVILTVLLGVGVPGFTNIIQNSRSTALANEIVTALNLARSESVKRAQEVIVCASADLNSCKGVWDGTNGWIVTLGVDGEDPLRVWEAPPVSAIIGQTGNTGDIVFNALGELSKSTVTLSTYFKGCTRDQARSINVNASGRINAKRVKCP